MFFVICSLFGTMSLWLEAQLLEGSFSREDPKHLRRRVTAKEVQFSEKKMRGLRF